MTERELQQTIIDAAAKLGWRHYHTWNSRKSDPGFPDIVLVKPEFGRVIWIECKAENGRSTAEQLAWQDALAMCGEEVYVVHPAELEEIEEIMMLGHKPDFLERCRYESAV